jgi:hypothetical protein
VRRQSKWALAAVLSVAGMAGAGYVAWQLFLAWCFPYGRRHVCSSALYLGLVDYASAHGGAFPPARRRPRPR